MYIYWYKCIYIGINVMKQNLFDGLSMHWRERDAPLWKIGGGEIFFVNFCAIFKSPPSLLPLVCPIHNGTLKSFRKCGFSLKVTLRVFQQEQRSKWSELDTFQEKEKTISSTFLMR